jgi:hypothetical protein
VSDRPVSPKLVRSDVVEGQQKSTAKGPDYSVEIVGEETAADIPGGPGEYGSSMRGRPEGK